MRLRITLVTFLVPTAIALAQDTAREQTYPAVSPAGVTSFTAAVAASPAGAASLAAPSGRETKRANERDLAGARTHSRTSSLQNHALQAPSPKPLDIEGLDVEESSRKPTGFPGISHFDQRRAGTGAYTNSQLSTEPPDQGLAVGNGYVVEAVNNALAVYSSSNRTLIAGPMPLNQFYGVAPEVDPKTGKFGDFLTDPRVYFDVAINRWFTTILQIDLDPATGNFGNRSKIMIAVSDGGNPTLGWHISSIDITDDGTKGTPHHANCPCFGDQPLIGADANGFFITTNEFPIDPNNFGFNGAQVYAISKLRLAAHSAATAVHFANIPLAEGMAYSLQPATFFRGEFQSGPGGNGVEYFLSALDFDNTLDDRIAVWAITNTASLASSSPHLSLVNTVIRSQTYGAPPSMQQKFGPTPLGTLLKDPLERVDAGDDRMMQTTFSAGRLWATLGTVVQVQHLTLAGAAYFSVSPSWANGRLQASVAAQGYIAVRENNVAYPSIAANSEGDSVIAMTLAGPEYFPSLAYSVVPAFEEPDSVRIAAAGTAPDDGFSGYPQFGGAGVGRWGDYTAAVADLDGSIWIAGEYIPSSPRTILANWGTFIARIRP